MIMSSQPFAYLLHGNVLYEYIVTASSHEGSGKSMKRTFRQKLSRRLSTRSISSSSTAPDIDERFSEPLPLTRSSSVETEDESVDEGGQRPFNFLACSPFPRIIFVNVIKLTRFMKTLSTMSQAPILYREKQIRHSLRALPPPPPPSWMTGTMDL